MDDLNSVISSILGDPQKMEQLRNVAQSLGMNPGGAPPAPGSGQDNNMGNMNPMGNMGNMGNMGGVNQPPPAGNMGDTPNMNANMGMGGMNNGMNMGNMGGNDNSGGNGSGFNLGSLSKLAGMFGGANNAANDKNVQLLRALQPHISESRAGRIDDAVRIMQLISAWPALRDSGLLGSLGNLFSGGGHR